MLPIDTKEVIKRQFIKEYTKKNFSLISVKGLCASTPVARTTFYSYYNNMDDVRRDIEDEILNGLGVVTDSISGGNLPDMDFSIYMDAVESYIKKHWKEISATYWMEHPKTSSTTEMKTLIKKLLDSLVAWL